MSAPVHIIRLGHLGDAIADGPEGPVYVARALPGELVDGERSGSRIAAPQILTPSPERVRAPCPHYRNCGGCALQHATDSFVAGWKTEVVRTALDAQGLSAPFRDMHISPPQSRRRATLAGKRLKKGVVVGFHARQSETVTAIPDCRLLHPDLLALMPVLTEITRAGASRRDVLALALTQSPHGADLSVSGGKPLDGPLRATLASMAACSGLARLAWEGEVIAQNAPPVQYLGATAVIPPPGAFLQATESGQAALQAAVTEAVGGADRIADLFAGCGTFALPLSAHAEIHAVEGDAAMLAALDHGWRHAKGLRKVTTETRDLFRNPLNPVELARFGAVVIDPPRAGAEAQMRALAASDVPVIAAVSCNPVSFARDARLLADAGYMLEWVKVIDQFRWSAHVELAAQLSKTHIGKA